MLFNLRLKRQRDSEWILFNLRCSGNIVKLNFFNEIYSFFVNAVSNNWNCYAPTAFLYNSYVFINISRGFTTPKEQGTFRNRCIALFTHSSRGLANMNKQVSVSSFFNKHLESVLVLYYEHI